MSDKKRPRGPVPHQTRPSSEGPLPDAFLESVDAALRESNPLSLLNLASGLIEAVDPRNKMGPSDSPASEVTLAEFCAMLDESGQRATDAVLKVMVELAGDDMLRERIRRSVRARRHSIPGWTKRLDQVRPTRALELTHVLRDGDNVVIGVQLPGNREISILIYIDHNLGTVVKDAFIIDSPLDEFLERWAESGATNGRVPGENANVELSLADARARVTAAINHGALTVPPYETDTWPLIRPIVEWVLRMMPPGGVGYEHAVFTEKQLADLTEKFFASVPGRGLDGDDGRALFASILRFGREGAWGDPLRWSQVAVEMLLMDWIPRKLIAPASVLAEVPDLLRGFIRFAHAERGISPRLTSDTLASVDRWEPEYLSAITGSGTEMPDLFSEEFDDADGFVETMERELLEEMIRTVGGEDALEELSEEPLPDEPIDWAGIPEDIHERVAEVGALVDGCADALFDIEFRTACRRFLSRVAAADPAIFRRRSSSNTAAAAVCWAIGQGNDSFGPEQGLRVSHVLKHLGVNGSPVERAVTIMRAVGIRWIEGPVELGDPTLLTSAVREDIVDMRDLIEE